MHYCGVVAARGLLQLAILEEVRTPDPPIRLGATFFEPGGAEQLAAEVHALGPVVVAVAAARATGRACDELLRRRGVPPAPTDPQAARLFEELRELGVFSPGPGHDVLEGAVPEGAFREAALLETNPDGIFYALQGRQIPSRRHPLGMQMRIDELLHDQVVDQADLWHRRIEEIEAAGAALCAHRYALGHASWLGSPREGVVVLPGGSLPAQFTRDGVLPPVPRLQLPPAD
jgi:hypothetical protein